jgi:glycosyltransferase involved in cell wall biosynthesis
MASRLAQQAPAVRCVLYGPRNQYIDILMSGKGPLPMPANLSFRGYIDQPEEALKELDVVVNLSHCQESFGRTVLEAMAAGRAVICYDWGALPELVVSGETGILVHLGESERVADLIVEFTNSSRAVGEMGAAGRRRAMEVYGHQSFMWALKQIGNELVKDGDETSSEG